MSKPRMMFYHDGRHQLIYAYEPPMQKEEYESAVDELAGTSIEALMFCLGDGRTVLHDTKVGELWGHNVDKWPALSFRRSAQIAKQLIEEGNDPLRVICDRAHAMGMLIYPTLLVQQGRLTAGGGEGAYLQLPPRKYAPGDRHEGRPGPQLHWDRLSGLQAPGGAGREVRAHRGDSE